MGNSIGNLTQLGTIAQDNKNLYYMSFEGNKPHLVKSDFEGNHKEVISESFCTQINVMGEWLYYINNEDHKIYKMDNMGNQKQKLSDISMRFLVVYKDTLYAICISNDDNNHLYSMDTKGNHVKNLTNEKISGFFLYDNVIYYTTYHREIGKCYMYSLDLNSMMKKEIFNNENDIPWFFVYRNKIYFLANGNLNSFDISNGNKAVEIYDKSITSKTINADGDLIFYYDAKTNNVNVLDIENDKNIEVMHGPVKYIHLLNDNIFYYINDELFSIKIDGSNKKVWGI